ncbi:MAG TPA: hypothetical protein VJ673_02730 [Aromatoleum sp.]|uniref:hypothetical protein n=1 Tax=Aromatoleum sp. TaxID=2307007 RepID=UPI002B464247|nr:hypothetical protein [Aromatoleum sp.]HJV24568.1 hypothetical protein [Aromatoleum sp.]
MDEVSGWDFGPGNFEDAGVNYGWESDYAASNAGAATSGNSFNYGAGLFGLANTYLKTDAAIRMQQSQDGRRYMEGQPYVQRNGGLTLSPGLLLLLVVGAIAYAAKD